MSILSDMVKGFMWGIGFSIALFGAATAYIMNVYAVAKLKDNLSLFMKKRMPN